MFKKILRALEPPIFRIFFHKLRGVVESPNILFDGENALFKDEVMKAEVYGEYGCGKSTRWVLNNTHLKVISVDTSDKWVELVKSNDNKNIGRLNIHHSNLGEVGRWGRPLSYE